MTEIETLDDLTRLGTLNRDQLLMTTAGIIKFTKPVEIPFSIKVTGDTVLAADCLAHEITFTGRRGITSSSAAVSLSLKNIKINTLQCNAFDIKPNTLERVLLDNVFLHTNTPGTMHVRSLVLTDTSFTHPLQQPLELGSCNSISANSVTNYSRYPVINLDDTCVVRDQIILQNYREVANSKGGFISIGIVEDDGTYLLATIPRRGILLKKYIGNSFEVLRVNSQGRYITPDLNAVRKFFG